MVSPHFVVHNFPQMAPVDVPVLTVKLLPSGCYVFEKSFIRKVLHLLTLNDGDESLPEHVWAQEVL